MVEQGFQAQTGLQMYADGHSTAGLNLYARRSHVFDEEAPLVALLFSTMSSPDTSPSNREANGPGRAMAAIARSRRLASTGTPT